MYALAGVPAAKNASQSLAVGELRATVMGTLDPAATELAALIVAVGVVVPPLVVEVGLIVRVTGKEAMPSLDRLINTVVV
jgi:hypothetical protein